MEEETKSNSPPHTTTNKSRSNIAMPRRVATTSLSTAPSKTAPHERPVTIGPCNNRTPKEPIAIAIVEYWASLTRLRSGKYFPCRTNVAAPRRIIVPRKAINRMSAIGDSRFEVLLSPRRIFCKSSFELPDDASPTSNGKAPFTGCPSALTTRHTAT